MIISGVVINGRHLGHKLGFPTANIAIGEDITISNGVYRSSVEICGTKYRAVSNLGTRPSVGGTHRNLETHIIDFDGDIYGQTISVELHEKLRDEQHFATIEDLIEQVNHDIEQVKNYK